MVDRTKKAKIIALTGNHLSTGDTPVGVKNLLMALMEKADNGELLGFSAAWAEGQNDIHSATAFGSARYGDLVAGVSGLLHDLNSRWGSQ